MKTKISLMMLLLAAWLLVGCEGQNEPTSEGGGSVESTDIASVNKVINFYGTVYEVILKDGNRMYFAIKNDKEVRMGCWSYFYDDCEEEYDTYAPYEYKGHLVIPEKITLEGKEYIVTELYDMSVGNCTWLTGSRNGYSYMRIKTFNNPNTTLLSVVIPKTIKEMESQCFSACTSLKSVTFENGSPLKELASTAFGGCGSLEDVVLPENITTIGDRTFAFCTSLKTIILPKSVTTIAGEAFYGCTALENINLENVTVIGDAFIDHGVFTGCTSLKTVNLESAVAIHQHVFYRCTSLENVRLDNLEVLGSEAFDSCTALQKVELPSIKYLGIDVEDNEEETWWAGGDAFVDCHALETLILGNSLIKTHQYELFEGCENLKDVYCYAVNPPIPIDWEEGDYDYREFIGDFVLYVPAGSREAYKETTWGEIYQLCEGSDDWYESVGYRTIVAIEE